nr:hypothetical protein [Candidatus Sigynarchaeota archaeon]
MKETILTEVTITRPKVTRITCDFCGKQFDKQDVENGWTNSIEITTTYASRHDGFRFIGDVCDDCIDKHFAGKLRKEEVAFL